MGNRQGMVVYWRVGPALVTRLGHREDDDIADETGWGPAGDVISCLAPCTCLIWNLQTGSPCSTQVKGPIDHSS